MRTIDADRLLEDMNMWNWNELHRIEDFARLVDEQPEAHTGRRKILRCPFCGSEAEVTKDITRERPYVVVCTGDRCGASTGWFRETRAEAIADWNRRTKE